ncbi:hypothetical protein VP1G_05431 [Cytospora mali]|uniref:Uncharacterized protein n=1 Tax=Cytospora mali TaxID=578113 RepID=A0A194V2L3_CYTMA|nr:hypothetical protein VP1G_05431 [Valsa mali var. pyri (nom. inval.)]
MLDDTRDEILKILCGLLAFIIALFGVAYTIVYYMITICLLGAGACLGLITWCIFRAVFQSIFERIPIKKFFDRRLHKNFISKIKQMECEKNIARDRLNSIIVDVRMRNKENNRIMEEIRINEAIIKRKVRGFESRVFNRYQVNPTVPDILVPPHQEPEAPSLRPIVRWLFAEDLQLYDHECAIARYEAQFSGEIPKIQYLDEEHAYLAATLDEINSRRSCVELLPDLPKPNRMAERTRKYLDEINSLRFKPSPYPHFVPPCGCQRRPFSPPSPPPVSKPKPFLVEIPKMTLGPLFEAASHPPLPTHTLGVAPPSNPDALFADPPRLIWQPSSAWGAPSVSAPVFSSAPRPPPPSAAAAAPPVFGSLFGPPPPSAPAAAIPIPPATPKVAPSAPASPPRAPNPLSLAERLSDPAGVRAPLPGAGSPRANPLSLAARLTDPTGVRAPRSPPAASIFEASESAEAGRRRSKEAERELARVRLAVRLGKPL